MQCGVCRNVWTGKAYLLLHAQLLTFSPSHSRTVTENAIASCLQVSLLTPENTAKAHIIRARARMHAGSVFGAQEDLQAALVAEPDNPEAKALLHKRSVAVEKVFSPYILAFYRLDSYFSCSHLIHPSHKCKRMLGFLPKYGLRSPIASQGRPSKRFCGSRGPLERQQRAWCLGW